MSVFTRVVIAFVLALVCVSPVAAQPPVPPEPPEEFIPIDQLPPGEEYPAAPLIIAAYSFALLAVFVYLLSVARRLAAVRREIERLESDLKRSGQT